jgi:cell division protein FtsL
VTGNTLRHEYFEELSALSSVGQLSTAQYQELADHLRTCALCREAHADFIHLTHDQLPLAVAETYEGEITSRHAGFLGKDYEARFAAEARARGMELSPPSAQRQSWIEWGLSLLPQLSNATATLLVLVGLVCASGILAYRWKDAESRLAELTPQVAELSSQNTELQKQLDALSQEKRAPANAPQMNAQEEKVATAQLKTLSEQVEKDSLALQTLNAQLSAASERAATGEQRAQDSEQKLHESERSLLAVQSELATLRAADTGNSGEKAAHAVEVAELSRRVHEQEELIGKQQQLLAVDQDVRNLMSARNLHITDIFDVDGKGKRKSAFGRVFYTEGKSLIFYAFDLDAPKFADAKHSFQAWGQLSDTSTAAVNLGIFYVDDPAQKRWTLRFDNPAVLDKLSAVFVTVEPHGGVAKPSGQKLMYAYLAREPNHP